MTRAAIVVSILLGLMVAPIAQAATRRATDRAAGIRFVLDGSSLTVRLTAKAPRRVRREVANKRVKAACGTNFVFSKGEIVKRTRRWPADRKRLRYRFDDDISRRAKWCLLEHPRGGDIAFVTFAS